MKRIAGFILLSLPALFFTWSMLDVMSRQALLGKLLFEGIGFPVVDWIEGSYWRTLVVWIGGTGLLVGWARLTEYLLRKET